MNVQKTIVSTCRSARYAHSQNNAYIVTLVPVYIKSSQATQAKVALVNFNLSKPHYRYADHMKCLKMQMWGNIEKLVFYNR